MGHLTGPGHLLNLTSHAAAWHDRFVATLLAVEAFDLQTAGGAVDQTRLWTTA